MFSKEEPMKIAGKASQNPQNGPIDYVEHFLPEFRKKLTKEKAFSYAWTFHPDEKALGELEEEVSRWLYLIGKPKQSPLMMHISDFKYSDKPIACPGKWVKYCIGQLWGINRFKNLGSIKLWLLIDEIVEIDPPEDITKFVPIFPNKYRSYGRNFFGFYH
jgi:hypothetical protein